MSMKKITTPRVLWRAQRGAVLIVSLIMLIVMTLFGITAMHTVTLEEKMVANETSHMLAFQAAESAVETTLNDKTNLKTALGGTPVTVSVDLQRASVTSSGQVTYLTKSPAPGYELSDEDSFAAYTFDIRGTGQVPSVNARVITAHGINVIGPGG